MCCYRRCQSWDARGVPGRLHTNHGRHYRLSGTSWICCWAMAEETAFRGSYPTVGIDGRNLQCQSIRAYRADHRPNCYRRVGVMMSHHCTSSSRHCSRIPTRLHGHSRHHHHRRRRRHNSIRRHRQSHHHRRPRSLHDHHHMPDHYHHGHQRHLRRRTSGRTHRHQSSHHSHRKNC